MKKNAFLKFFTLLLAFAALFSLSACGGKTEMPATAAKETAAPAESAAPEGSSEPEASAEAEADPEASTAPESALPPLPDIDINSWEFAVANSYNSVSEYEPPYGSLEGQGIDARIVEKMSNFLNAARDEGYSVYSAVSYRNYEHILNSYIKPIHNGTDAATVSQTILGPGLNEHQTGLCFDLTTDQSQSISYGHFHQDGIENTDAYKWMVEHCQDYGFILRYPEGKEEYYGTPCSNVHFRYVGEEAAKYIMENDLCLEEFIRLYDENAVFVPAIDVEK